MSKSVLVIDDSLTVRMYHKQILQGAGFEVDEAENGMEALEKSNAKEYDLLSISICPYLMGIVS